MFSELVKGELADARLHHGSMASLHEGFAILLEEVDELKAEVWKKPAQRRKSDVLAELVQVAAMAQRMAEDCGRLE